MHQLKRRSDRAVVVARVVESSGSGARPLICKQRWGQVVINCGRQPCKVSCRRGYGVVVE